MRLFHSPTTPFGRKIVVALQESGLARAVTVVNVAGSPIAPGTLPLASNPLGKIPTLELDDGQAIFDSRVICRYLDSLTNGILYPVAPKLWQTLTLEALADGMLDAAVIMAYEIRLRPEEKQYPAWLEAQWAKIDRALDALNSEWSDHLNGPFDMAQIAVGCALGYLDFRHNARNWRKGRPPLTTWYEAFSQRDSMRSTEPKV